MKAFLAGLLFMTALAAGAGEAVFIPGWNTEFDPEAEYAIPLRAIYPHDRITVLKWRSNSLKFDAAIDNADAFVPEVLRYIAGKTPAERAELTLIGHSLGGRIAIEAAARLAKDGIKVKRIVLLGAAVDCDVDLAPVVAASTLPVVNVFSTRDFALKHAYPKTRHASPLGFCGAAEPPAAGLVEYLVTPSESPQKPEVHVRAYKGIRSHNAVVYLNELRRIADGGCAPYRPKYDYSRVERYLKDSETPLTLPKHWGIQLESGIDCWDLLKPLLPAWLGESAVPGRPEVLDSYAGWKLVKLPVELRKTNRLKMTVKFTKDVYFVVDHYERIRLWNLSYFLLRDKFAAIRSLIVENR